MKNQELTGLELVIDVWKKNNIAFAKFNFDCGGDSMGDTELVYIVKRNADESSSNNDVINQGELPELDDYFDGVIYNEVDFYVNSDGHYLGESGFVEITLDDDEKEFCYVKEAYEQYSEEISGDFSVEITEEQKNFLTEYVSSISIDSYSQHISYKKDLILDDEKRALADGLMEYLLEQMYEENDFEYPNDFEVDDREDRRCEVDIDQINNIEQLADQYFLDVTFFERGTVTRFGEY